MGEETHAELGHADARCRVLVEDAREQVLQRRVGLVRDGWAAPLSAMHGPICTQDRETHLSLLMASYNSMMPEWEKGRRP